METRYEISFHDSDLKLYFTVYEEEGLFRVGNEVPKVKNKPGEFNYLSHESRKSLGELKKYVEDEITDKVPGYQIKTTKKV